MSGYNPRPHCTLVLSVTSRKSALGLWRSGHNGVLEIVVVKRIPKVCNGRRPMSPTQPVGGGVTTRHEFVVNGWIKAFVSADPFCRLETSTSTRQPNGHDYGKPAVPVVPSLRLATCEQFSRKPSLYVASDRCLEIELWLQWYGFPKLNSRSSRCRRVRVVRRSGRKCALGICTGNRHLRFRFLQHPTNLCFRL